MEVEDIELEDMGTNPFAGSRSSSSSFSNSGNWDIPDNEGVLNKAVGLIGNALGKIGLKSPMKMLGKLKRAVSRIPSHIRNLGSVVHPSTGERVTEYVNYSRPGDAPNLGVASSFLSRLPAASKVVKYGLPAALIAALAAATGYAIYTGVKSHKKKKAEAAARAKAVDIFMKTASRSAPTLFSSRKDQMERVRAVAADIIRNARDQEEATEGLKDLMSQTVALERRLVPNPVTPGYEWHPVGGQLRSPIRA